MKARYPNSGFSGNVLYDVFQQTLRIPLRFKIIICFRGSYLVINIGMMGKMLMWMHLN